jgi:DNA-binding CsgD family transcriptional regulator
VSPSWRRRRPSGVVWRPPTWCSSGAARWCTISGGWERVRLHAYHSERVLARSPFLAALAPVASFHHERLDGSGYHRGTAAADVTPPAGLTEREAEVLALLARGLQTKQVARRLGISVKTADHHVQNAYAKIGVSTRAAAALFAMQHGLTAWGELPIGRTPERS